MLVIIYANLDYTINFVQPNRLNNGINSFHTPIHSAKNRTRGGKGERGNRSAREETVEEKGERPVFAGFSSFPPFSPKGASLATGAYPLSGRNQQNKCS